MRVRMSPKTFLKRDEWLTPFDKLFDDMLGQAFPAVSKDLGSDFFAKGSYPKVNIVNNADAILIEAALPGMEKDQINVEMLDGAITISGKLGQDKKEDTSNFILREIKKSAFRRTFSLGDNLDQEKVSAEYSNGILLLKIPKIKPSDEEKTTRKIKIS